MPGQFVYTGSGKKQSADADSCVRSCKKIACQIQMCMARNGSMETNCKEIIKSWDTCCQAVRERERASAEAVRERERASAGGEVS